MLKKLLKKDFQSTSRCFLPLIIGFVILSVLCKILFEIGFTSMFRNDSMAFTFIVVIFMGLYVIYIIGYCIMTIVFIVSDFYATLVGEQGYLTHTLPVKTSTLIFSKLLISMFWQVITGLLVVLSVSLFFIGHVTISDIRHGLSMIQQITEIPPYIYTFYIIIFIVLSLIQTPLMFYVSIAMGHLFGKHRIIGAIASYLGLYTILQILSTMAMLALGYSVQNHNSLNRIFSSYTWFAIIFSIVTTLAFYFVTEFIFRKKLNLE